MYLFIGQTYLIYNVNWAVCLQVLHYGQELFEGMKAYRGLDEKIRLFRPMLNMSRMVTSAEKASLPDFDGEHLMQCIIKYAKNKICIKIYIFSNIILVI